MDNTVINTISLFSGVGMLDEGLHAGLGFLGIRSRTVMYAEREAYPVSVLEARMEEGSLPPAPIWFGDLCELDASQFSGVVDCVVAGFPCQDLSLAGRRAGLDGKRSGLFFEVTRIARDCGARYLFLENVAGIASAAATVVDEAEGALDERAAARVLGELADLGWHAEWVTLSASDVGASHGRSRWFCWAWRMANTVSHGAPKRPQEQRGDAQGIRAPKCAGDSGDAGTAMDDAGRMQRRTGHEQDRPGATEAGEHEAHDRAADGGAELGHTGLQHQHLQQREDGAEHSGAGGCVADASSPDGTSMRWGGKKEVSSTGTDSRGIFAPGPAYPAWPGIIQQWPHLAPALEPSFHSMADGLAYDMDDCRPQRLKCCGNGVVAAQAAFALVGLVRRMCK